MDGRADGRTNGRAGEHDERPSGRTGGRTDERSVVKGWRNLACPGLVALDALRARRALIALDASTAR